MLFMPMIAAAARAALTFASSSCGGAQASIACVNCGLRAAIAVDSAIGGDLALAQARRALRR